MERFEYYGFQEKLKIEQEINLECQNDKKDLTRVDGKTYTNYMCDYNELKAKQIRRTKNQEKVDQFEKFFKVLPQYAKDNEFDVVVDWSEDELNVTLKITTDYIYGDCTNEFGKASAQFLNALFRAYPNYILSAEDSVMTFTFFIHLYDEEDTGEHNDVLEQIAAVMKDILKEDHKTE